MESEFGEFKHLMRTTRLELRNDKKYCVYMNCRWYVFEEGTNEIKHFLDFKEALVYLVKEE